MAKQDTWQRMSLVWGKHVAEHAPSSTTGSRLEKTRHGRAGLAHAVRRCGGLGGRYCTDDQTEAGKSTSVLDDAATQARVAMPKMAGLPAGVYGAMRASGWGDPASGMRRKQKPRSVKAAGLLIRARRALCLRPCPWLAVMRRARAVRDCAGPGLVHQHHPELGEFGCQHITAAGCFGCGFADGGDGSGAFGGRGLHQFRLSSGFGRDFAVAGDQFCVCNGLGHRMSRSMGRPLSRQNAASVRGRVAWRRSAAAAAPFEGMMADIETNGGV